MSTADMSERAERLRHAVAAAVAKVVPDMDPPLDSSEAAVVLRAVVEELGVTWRMASNCEKDAETAADCRWDGTDGYEPAFAPALALVALLEAAGVERD